MNENTRNLAIILFELDATLFGFQLQVGKKTGERGHHNVMGIRGSRATADFFLFKRPILKPQISSTSSGSDSCSFQTMLSVAGFFSLRSSSPQQLQVLQAWQP